MPASDKPLNEMRIVLVGKTGVGKSAVGNSLLKKKHFKSSALSSSVTSKCHYGARKLKDGTNLVIVDTPGIFDTSKANEETVKEVVRCIGLSSPGPHAFFFVLKIGARFTEEEKNTIDFLKHIFGDQVMSFVIVVFTGKDVLEEEGISLDKYVSEATADLIQLIGDCNGRYVAINNFEKNQDEKEKDIQVIFKAIQDTMERNQGMHYTGEMYAAAEEAFEEKLRLLEEEKHKKERELDQREKRLEEKDAKMKKKVEEKMAEERKALDEEQRQRDVESKRREEGFARETERLNNLRAEEEEKLQRRREKMNQLAAELKEERRQIRKDKDRDAKERKKEKRRLQKVERRLIEEERRKNEEERRRNEEEIRKREEKSAEEMKRRKMKLEKERLKKMKEIEEEREAEMDKLREERRKLKEENMRNKLRTEVQDNDNFFVSFSKKAGRGVKKCWNAITGVFEFIFL